MYCSYLIVLSMTAEIELATFGSEVKCLTPRPSWICKKRCFLDSSKHAARPGKNENLQNWCGNILSLVWKFFFSGVEIFCFRSFPMIGTSHEKFPHQFGNFSFSFLSYASVEDFRRNFYQCKMSGEMFSSPKYGIIFNSARCQEKSLTVQDVRRNL